MTGTLQRLFTFAKATGSSQLENFTTEVLAAAIEAEPRVFVPALTSRGLVPPSERVEEVHVATQVHVPGGVVDLAMELVLDGRPRLFWIEVKAHAGLHGPQLQVYVDAAATYPVVPKPRVIMLCKRPMGVLDLMADQFRKHRRLVVPSKRYPWVNFGLVFEPATELAVWIEFSPKDFAARDAIFARATSSALPHSWTMHASGWAWLGTSTAVDSELDHEVAIKWLTERFTELREAGIFAELKKWRRYGRLGVPADGDADADDEGDEDG